MLGKTGLNVSVLGLGGHEYRWGSSGHLSNGRFTELNPEREKVVSYALDQGINYFDTTFTEEAQSLGYITGKNRRRKDMIISGMIISACNRCKGKKPPEVKEWLTSERDTRLKLLGSDYFDIFMMGVIDNSYDRALALDVADFFIRTQEEGFCRFIGISGHDHGILASFLQEDIPVDVAMFPYNYAASVRWGNLYEGLDIMKETVAKKNIGVIAIKPLVWTIYGVPCTCFIEPELDIQQGIEAAAAWQSTQDFAQVSVFGVETVPELKTILSSAGQPADAAFLEELLNNSRRFDLLCLNAPRHSAEIYKRVLEYAKIIIGRDLGGDLNAYVKYWKEELNGSLLPPTRV